jgi:hypothetical protein
MRTWSPATKCHRTGQPICWQHGDTDHLRRDCRHGAISTGNGGWKAPYVEAYCRLQSYLQELLDSVELSGGEVLCAGASLGVCQWKVQDSTHSSTHSKVNEVQGELHVGSTGGRLDVNKTLHKVRQQYYWLRARSDIGRWCQQCDTWVACKGPQNPDAGPDAPV